MAQAGVHGLVGLAVKRWTPQRRWLMLGIVLGHLAPDADNLAVAVATVTGAPTEGLHRTFTHSLITVAGIVVLGYVVAWLAKRPRWDNLGLGLGIGIVMHVLRPPAEPWPERATDCSQTKSPPSTASSSRRARITAGPTSRRQPGQAAGGLLSLHDGLEVGHQGS